MNDKENKEETTVKGASGKQYTATPLLVSTRFSLLPESVQAVGREEINKAKSGEAVKVDKPDLRYFKEAK